MNLVANLDMTLNTAPAHFSQTYREARSKFIAAADVSGLDLQSHAHPLLGSEREPLAVDVVRDGPLDAESVLIVSSGCHGVEGFCGSGVQTALLHDNPWRAAAAAAGVAVLYVHALNPHGFSWWRRTTHENVDLNRNFHDFSTPLPRNDGYAALADAIVPAQWPPSPENEAVLAAYAEQHGFGALQEAVSGGQYAHPQGLFYGGRNPTWSHSTLRRVLAQHAARCTRLGWIDLHAGLGASGVGERIFACRDEPAALARARAWWGAGLTSLYDGSSSSARLQGLMWNAVYDTCAQAEYTGIALEFGTIPLLETIAALRADQWAENHPDAPRVDRERIKRQIRDAFYVDTDDWKRRVVEQAFDAARGAVRGLAHG